MADMRRAALTCSLAAYAAATALLAGCASDKNGPTTRPATVRDRQDAALRDPFGYKVMQDEDVSGGKLHEFKGDAMKRDLNNVLNP